MEVEENLIQKDNPNEQHNPSQQKSNMKRPLEVTGEGNAKKSKTFHPLQEEPSTSGIEINLMTPVSRQRQYTGKGGNGRGQCRGSIWGRGIGRDTNRGRGQGRGHEWGTGQTNKLKKELQHLEIKMEMMEIKYRTMVDNISVLWFQWKLKMSSFKLKCPLW